MKHLLNDLSIEEKNRIREQHEGGMTIDTSKFRKLMETKLGDVKPILNEDDPGNLEMKVSGPFGKAPIQYYVYDKGGKFYIYQTNATQKTPILMGGTLWSNNGKGYDKQADAEVAIQNLLKGGQDTKSQPIKSNSFNTNSMGMQ